MAFERKNRVKDTTTTTGTGTLSLAASAPAGYRTFVAGITSGATVRYLIESADLSEWEVGIGVFTDATPDTLTRVTVYASSNAGALVNFSAGTKNVSCTLAAEDLATKFQSAGLSGNFSVTSTSMTDVTGLSLSVVLEYTSHVRVTVQAGFQNNTNARFFSIQVLRGTTVIRNMSIDVPHSGIGFDHTYVFFDESVAAGTYTYKVQISVQSGDTCLFLDRDGKEFCIESMPA